MTTTYYPKGVCSREMKIEVEDNIIKKVVITGGCSGNTQGVARLVEGMAVDEVIARLEAVVCGDKATSCPAQLAQALKQLRIKNEE